MKNPPSIAPLFDDAVARLRRDGFTAIYKARGRVTGPGMKFEQSNPGERIKLDDDSFTLEEGEHWFPVHYDGKNYVTIYYRPEGLDPKTALLHLDDPNAIREPYWLSSDSRDFIERTQYFYRCRSKNVTATFKASTGEQQEIKTHRDHLETLPEWKSRNKVADHVIQPVKGAGDAGQAERFLSHAIEELKGDADELTPAQWRALESAFKAGQQSNESDSWEARGISIKGEPLVTKQHTQHAPRREWTKAATAILRNDIKTPARIIAESLKKEGICDFDTWGDDVEFYGEHAETKTRGAFDRAISGLRRELRK